MKAEPAGHDVLIGRSGSNLPADCRPHYLDATCRDARNHLAYLMK
jgi:hypothetical protein